MVGRIARADRPSARQAEYPGRRVVDVCDRGDGNDRRATAVAAYVVVHGGVRAEVAGLREAQLAGFSVSPGQIELIEPHERWRPEARRRLRRHAAETFSAVHREIDQDRLWPGVDGTAA